MTSRRDVIRFDATGADPEAAPDTEPTGAFLPESPRPGRRQVSGPANSPEARARQAAPAGPSAAYPIIGHGPASLSQEAPSC